MLFYLFHLPPVTIKMERREKLFRQVLDKHKDKIYRLCSAWLYDKQYTDDLFHDVLINIWNGLDRFKGRSTLNTWVYRVTVNSIITYNKSRNKEKRLFTSLAEKDEVAVPGDTGEMSKQQRIKRLRACIARLNQQERLLMSLVLEEMSYAEISEVLGITVNHVGVKINRARKKLMRLYKNG